MRVIALQIIGWVAFVLTTLTAGMWLRRHPDRESAEQASRVVHGLFFAGMVFPGAVGVLYPGPRAYDRFLGLPPLPLRKTRWLLGGTLLAAGTYLLLASNVALRKLGAGANAFRLTRRLVDSDIYRRTRNPMSLGYYLTNLGGGLVVGSTAMVIWALAGLMPAHLFALTYFEELELELRLGDAYRQYKPEVPFLLPRLRAAKRSEAA